MDRKHALPDGAPGPSPSLDATQTRATSSSPGEGGTISLEEAKQALHEARVRCAALQRENAALRAENLQRESEERYRLLTEHIKDVIWTLDVETRRFTYVSPSVFALRGYTPEEIMAEPMDAAMTPEHAAYVARKLQQDVAVFLDNERAGRPQPFDTTEIEQPCKEDTTVWTEVITVLRRNAQTHRIEVLGITRDIAERRRAQKALKRSNERLQLALSAAKAGTWEWDLTTDENTWSDEIFTLYGIAPDVCKPSYDIWRNSIHPDDRERVERQIQDAVRNGHPISAEWRVNRPNGFARWLMSRGQPEHGEGGQVVRYIGIVIDITERKQVEVEREKLAQQRQLALDAAEMGWWHYDPVTRMASWDDRYQEIFGVTGHSDLNDEILKRLHPDDLPGVWRSVEAALDPADPQPYAVEYRINLPDGTMKWIEAHGIAQFEGSGAARRATSFVGTVADISIRKRIEEEKAALEDQFRQAQKMESVGRLAGGVAHDFNNMLGVILGHTEMALDQVDPAQPLCSDLQAIEAAAIRSAELTRQLLAFARKQTVAPRVLDLNDTVANMLKIIHRLIGEDIRLEWRPGSNLWPVYMDPSQIDQILANLCVNARDAISGVGTITIETANHTVGTTYDVQHAALVPGYYVQMVVRDTGCGMGPDTLARIFEPFFTTKDVGEGTGLGLATVYGAVKQNNGFIDVHSQPGAGTTVTIYLPRHRGRREQTVMDGATKTAKRGQETILLVEDEPAILTLTMRMLEGQGYTVLAANTPGEALRLAAECAGKIDLLMTDVIMPEMNGHDLAESLRSKYPNLKRLFMSGYTPETIAVHTALDAGVFFLQKPFSMKVLVARVREALESGGDATASAKATTK